MQLASNDNVACRAKPIALTPRLARVSRVAVRAASIAAALLLAACATRGAMEDFPKTLRPAVWATS
jgi:hypothetical protein